MAEGALDQRRKMIITLLAAAAVYSAYSRLIAAPLKQKTIEVQRQIQKFETQLKDLSQKLPPVDELKGRVAALEDERKKYDSEIDAIEKKLPSRLDTSKFIAQVTELAKEVKIDSVKQRVEKEEAFSRLYLEIQFTATYSAAVRYVESVESITPYIKLEKMEITEPKIKANEKVGAGSPMKLLVSCLLGDSKADVPLNGKGPSNRYKEVRDLLASKAKPSSMLRQTEYHVEGITYNPSNPTAIINGDVYQVGSEIGGYKVKAIGPDTVILADGVEEQVLNVKR